MKRTALAFGLGLIVFGCDSRDPTAPATQDRLVNPQFSGGGIVHRASVGSHDLVPPGVDANYSLVALQHSDGRITGEFTDRFANGDGFHARVTCLSVVANDAYIGGVITQPKFAKGVPVVTRVRDNGFESENDPPDEISFSFIGVPAEACLARDPAAELFPIDGGEVKVE
jgi:hypothetical protein